MLDFTGQVVLITGAGPLKGLNRTIAHSFGRQGANIALCGINNGDVDTAAKELLSRGYESIGFVASLTERESIDNLVDCIVKLYGRIDVLVCDADIFQKADSTDKTGKQSDFSFNDLPLITQAVCEVMKKQKYGRIVNISSASKTTRQRISRNLSRKISQHSVNCYCAYLGLINTDIWVSMPPELSEVLIANISMGSSGKVQEAADAIMFLASNSLGKSTANFVKESVFTTVETPP